MSEDLNTKSLGEKLCEAITPVMKCWPALTDASRSGYEQAALHFAASLSHDETANAVITDLRQRLQAAEERAEKVEGALHRIKEASNPTIRIERPRLNLDRAWEIADAALKTDGEGWKALGFDSAEHEDEELAKGRAALKTGA